MIVVHKEKCGACGLCARICHENCIKVDNTAAAIEHPLCSTCTQCIAVCPNRALS